ncbi:hypothetical protein Y032_0020g69 [Ancylostoma ceylanicum]|uniref:Uncharacterized protein n=1 Tax=Ancylostoma ceylanicum TaxID=53326 RepID=A0A016V1V3_9BILA|nr:hypothetical protein Y032_0020g69 [Ancylostoma ceylanicum]
MRQCPLNTAFRRGSFFGACESREVGEVGVLVNMNLVMNIDSFEELTTQFGPLRLRGCGSMPSLVLTVIFDTGEELFIESCDSRRVQCDRISALVNTNLLMEIN